MKYCQWQVELFNLKTIIPVTPRALLNTKENFLRFIGKAFPLCKPNGFMASQLISSNLREFAN